jgi:transposase InsO family protein
VRRCLLCAHLGGLAVPRRVVGFAMAEHLRADLVCSALQMAINLRRSKPGLLWLTCSLAERPNFEFIEVFDNRQRIHSSLGNVTPVEHERRAGRARITNKLKRHNQPVCRANKISAVV